MNVSLPPELERVTRSLVKTGRYSSASEVVRNGLRLLLEQEARSAEQRAILDERLEQAARGEAVPFDGERIKSVLLKTAAEARAGRA